MPDPVFVIRQACSWNPPRPVVMGFWLFRYQLVTLWACGSGMLIVGVFEEVMLVVGRGKIFAQSIKRFTYRRSIPIQKSIRHSAAPHDLHRHMAHIRVEPRRCNATFQPSGNCVNGIHLHMQITVRMAILF